jgi:hypothetical protein
MPSKTNKKKDKKEIIMPLKFNIGLQKYEPDMEKLKQIKKSITRRKTPKQSKI